MEREQLYNNLIAIAINGASNGHGHPQEPMKSLMVEFFNLPLRDIMPFWDKLSSQVKIKIVESNLEEFRKVIEISSLDWGKYDWFVWKI